MSVWHRCRSPWVQRGLVSLGLLGAVALWVEPQAVLAEIQRLSLSWMLLAFMISVLQVMLSAWRWKFTADLVDVPLRYGYALREYYLALLINQLLPGGVLGDAGRAHRHAKQSGSRGGAWRAVVIERASGQVALVLLTLLALLTSPLWHAALGWPVLLTLGAVLILAGVISAALFVWLRRSSTFSLPAWCRTFGRDVQRSLLRRGVWIKQLLSSLAIVVSYGLVMVCAARAIGVELPALDILALTPLLLLAMLVPLSIAGWGLREGIAATIWAFVGLPSAQGVAVSLGYGVLIMLSSLPGIWVALSKRTKATPSGSGSRQAHIEQRVVTTPEGSQGGAQRTLQGVDGRHHQAGPTRANQQGGDQQMQALDGPCLYKLRNSDAPALHQYPREAAFRQQFNDIVGIELASGTQGQYAVLRGWRCGVYRRPRQVQRRRHISIEKFQVGRHTATRVDHHTGGVIAANMAYRQLRVISAGGACAHQDCVGQSTQPVQVPQTFKTVDVVRVATFRGNSPIKALPQLGDAPCRAARQWQQAIKQLTGGRRDVQRRVPIAVGVKRYSRRAWHGVANPHQPRPCGLNIDDSISLSRLGTISISGVGHDVSLQTISIYHAGRYCLAQAYFARYNWQSGGRHVSH